jgi:hypothetical protein
MIPRCLRVQALQSLFNVVPSEGSIPSGGQQVLDVVFNLSQSLKSDLILPGEAPNAL